MNSSPQRRAALVACAVIVVIAACREPAHEPDNGWGRSLATSLHLPAGRVTCPKDAGSSTLGLRFDCTAIDDARRSFPVHVLMDFGPARRAPKTSWSLDGVLVDEAVAAAPHAPELGPDAAIHCPALRVFLKRGDSFTCEASVSGARRVAILTSSGDDGALTASIAGAAAATATPKPAKGACGCAAGDLMCAMRCSAK